MEKLETKIKSYYEGKEYSYRDLKTFVNGYVANKVNDELMTKFIKSIYEKPLSIATTTKLTEIMMHSGDMINLDDISGITVDKHSTGGVGDKITLIVGPIVAALGGFVSKMSGRGLGFTGGTIDKLESIPGLKVFLTDDEFKANLQKHKIVVIGQTKNLVPADKKIYALRNETNLIASMPLIASSIMSKKLATGAKAILIDVKVGDAAFMKTQAEGEELARWMIGIGRCMKRDIRAEITSMATPLGFEIGNRNEVLEAIRFLEGKPPAQDLNEVVYSSAATMLIQAQICKTKKAGYEAINKVIKNGQAIAKFRDWIQAQSGDLDILFSSQFWNPRFQYTVKNFQPGFFNILSAVEFGILAMELGAGRKKKNDAIDFDAGISLHVKSGDFVKKGAALFTLYSSKPISDHHKKYLQKAYEIANFKKTKQTILNTL